ncbi:MAG: deoxyribodipyrimidine photo-lyase, partial [Cyclobacteriaceae bacterium]
METKVINKKTTLLWLRRDLRLSDNVALYHALKDNKDVLPLFIFDKEILGKLEDKDDARVNFIYNTLQLLKSELEKMGSSLLVVHNTPAKFFNSISPKSVYANEDYEPYARERDTSIAQQLAAKNVEFKIFKDHVIFAKEDILKNDGTPYTVFTPYSKRWKVKLTSTDHKEYVVKKYLDNLIKTAPIPLPTLKQIGFSSTKIDFPPRLIKSSIIEHYGRDRNYPAKHGTTQLSIHLRFGTVSIRKLVTVALKKNETWLNELIWRDFYHMILWHFPNVDQSFKPAYDRIEWRNNPDEFQAWCDGKTGYPIVDAGMRELNTTGFMHNRVRMIVASFLVKHLLIDWRWGEAYFARKLLDFDLAANNGGWQWAA